MAASRGASSSSWKAVLRRIARARPAEQALHVLASELHSENFDIVHASIGFRRLARLRKTLTSDMLESPACASFMARTRELLSCKPEELSGYEREICGLFWALAKLRGRAPQLPASLAPVVADSLSRLPPGHNLNAVDFANLCWAMAALRRPVPELRQLLLPWLAPKALLAFEAVDNGVVTSQAISNVAWALGVLGEVYGSEGVRDSTDQSCRQLLEVLCCQAKRQVSNFTPQEVATFCWGLALCGHCDEELMMALAEHVACGSDDSGSPELDLPQIALAFARLGLWHEPLMIAVATRTTPLLPNLNPWGLCALTFSVRTFSPHGKLQNFRQVVELELADRCFDEEDVERSKNGPEEWE